MSKSLRKYLANMTNDERWNALLEMTDRLIELEEVRYRMDDYDVDEALIWTADGSAVGSIAGAKA